MPRLRVTTRSLMVAVAIIGLVTAADLEWERQRESSRKLERLSVFYLVVRNQHEIQASQWAKDESLGERMLSHTTEDGKKQQIWIDYVRMTRDLHNYHAKLADKYNQAALHPWIPVGPDIPAPPEPIERPMIFIDD